MVLILKIEWIRIPTPAFCPANGIQAEIDS